MKREEFDLSTAVDCRYGKFPPKPGRYETLMKQLAATAAALAGFDRNPRTLHDSQIPLAPLGNREAAISSRMEGAILRIYIPK